MTCSACASVITRTLKKIPSVRSCDINLANNLLNIESGRKITDEEINEQISRMGYRAVEDGDRQSQEISELNGIRDSVLQIFPFSILFTALMVVVYWIPIDILYINLLGFLVSSWVVYITGKKYLFAILSYVRFGNGNMNTLIGIGVFVAYIYSIFLWFFPGLFGHFGNNGHTYFDVVIVVVGFVTFGKYLEIKTKKRTGDAVEKLFHLGSKFAFVKRGKNFVEIKLDEVNVGDILLVKPGQKIPVDGVVVSGDSYVDESMMSGEAAPIKKKKGDVIVGATINKQGSFEYRATRIGKDMMLSQIIKMVSDAQNSRIRVQDLTDKIAGKFVPFVLVLTVITFVCWMIVGDLQMALVSAVGVLVIACPCALGLATPLGVVVGVGKAASRGILFKNAEVMEKLSKIDTVVFDKTGTLTRGFPKVVGFEKDVLRLAACVEQNSSHPLAIAIIAGAKEHKLKLSAVDNFREIEGFGVEGVVEGSLVVVRKYKPEDLIHQNIKNLSLDANTIVVVEMDGRVLGAISIEDEIKEDVVKVVELLNKMKIEIIILSGDMENVVKQVAEKTNISKYFSGMMPQDKINKIRDLKSSGRIVAMVGDGINDAPSLAAADVGIAMSTGTDVAISASDITILGSKMILVIESIEISKQTLRVIRENLFWAFIYNIVGLPIATGLFASKGIVLNPALAGAAMAMSSLSVVMNSLRLRFIRT